MTFVHRLVILYSSGGLGDVGRHALQAALERPLSDVAFIKVVTQFPERLQDTNWNCGCEHEHGFRPEDKERFQVVGIKSWDAPDVDETLNSAMEGATAVISALGNRQPFFGDLVAETGSRAVVKAMKAQNVKRVIAISSVGIGEDWPPMEWHWYGSIMKWLFRTICRDSYQDLTKAHKVYQDSDLDFLLVLPGGLSEDAKPVGKWFVQKKKFQDKLGEIVAKLDVARFMVEEALNPTRHREAVVVSSEPSSPQQEL